METKQDPKVQDVIRRYEQHGFKDIKAADFLTLIDHAKREPAKYADPKERYKFLNLSADERRMEVLKYHVARRSYAGDSGDMLCGEVIQEHVEWLVRKLVIAEAAISAMSSPEWWVIVGADPSDNAESYKRYSGAWPFTGTLQPKERLLKMRIIHDSK